MNTSSIFTRAVLAVALMIGFYLLAVLIALGLLYVPYAEVVYAHRLHIKLALICVISALAILWSVLPRIDKLEAPGPGLSKEAQPRLFEEIESVAKAARQAMPKEVYLVGDVNAWVAQRGGIMGFGSRRVMGLGLPLMRVLTRSQFRAVLAHEFGHYERGDTKLGPWVYKTRAAIGRTLSSLGDGSLLQLLFLWYGKLFLRISHAVSRQQEFLADRLAARIAGARALIDGLRTIHRVAPAFAAYWGNECTPVLQSGYRPPVLDGFQKFIDTERISQHMDEALEDEMKQAKADPYDTHPALKDRIAAVEDLAKEAPSEDSPAISLLENVKDLERELLSHVVGPEHASNLKLINWQEVCTTIYIPVWRKLAQANASVLSSLRLKDLPEQAGKLESLGSKLVDCDGEKAPEADWEDFAASVIGAAVALMIVDSGGIVTNDPGSPITAELKGSKIEPFKLMAALGKGEVSVEQWVRIYQSWGLDSLNLAPGSEAAKSN